MLGELWAKRQIQLPLLSCIPMYMFAKTQEADAKF